ncbi:hypothetical protein Tco_0397643 [Tanacetum coccineum]
MEDRGIFDSGCSGHMTGNKDHLNDFEECKGRSVTFGGSKGYITEKDAENFFPNRGGIYTEEGLDEKVRNKKKDNSEVFKTPYTSINVRGRKIYPRTTLEPLKLCQSLFSSEVQVLDKEKDTKHKRRVAKKGMVFGKDLSEQEFCKQNVTVENLHVKLSEESRNLKLSQLKKLKFEEIKEEFETSITSAGVEEMGGEIQRTGSGVSTDSVLCVTDRLRSYSNSLFESCKQNRRGYQDEYTKDKHQKSTLGDRVGDRGFMGLMESEVGHTQTCSGVVNTLVRGVEQYGHSVGSDVSMLHEGEDGVMGVSSITTSSQWDDFGGVFRIEIDEMLVVAVRSVVVCWRAVDIARDTYGYSDECTRSSLYMSYWWGDLSGAEHTCDDNRGAESEISVGSVGVGDMFYVVSGERDTRSLSNIAFSSEDVWYDHTHLRLGDTRVQRVDGITGGVCDYHTKDDSRHDCVDSDMHSGSEAAVECGCGERYLEENDMYVCNKLQSGVLREREIGGLWRRCIGHTKGAILCGGVRVWEVDFVGDMEEISSGLIWRDLFWDSRITSVAMKYDGDILFLYRMNHNGRGDT